MPSKPRSRQIRLAKEFVPMSHRTHQRVNSTDAAPSGPTLTERDRRLCPRYTLQVQIELHQQGSADPLRLQTTDISRGGCYVQMPTPLPVGVFVQAILWLDSYPIVIRGPVVTHPPQFANRTISVDFKGPAEQLLNPPPDTTPPQSVPDSTSSF